MQINNAVSANQFNPYAQAQAREANPVDARQVDRKESVKPQTDNAVNAAAEEQKAAVTNKQDNPNKIKIETGKIEAQNLANENAQQIKAANEKPENPGTKRGTLVDITA